MAAIGMLIRRAACAGLCRVLVAGAGGAAAVCAPAAVAQQVNAVAPYVAVVEADDAVLRAGPGDLMYPVQKLARTQMLRVDGEATDAKGKTWARVAYPRDGHVFVQADAVQASPGAKEGTITKVVQPKAPNMTTGFKGSWSPVLSQALQPGTKVEILGAEAAPGGQGAAGYRIAPPEGARAYVLTTSLRKATPQEAAAMASGQAQPESTPQVRPLPPQPTTGGNGAANRGTSLTEPMVPGGTPAGTQPANMQPVPGGEPTPGAGADGQPVEIEQRPVERPANPYEQLEASFEELRKQPVDTAEYAELMGQYQAEVEKLDDSPASKLIRARLLQRIEYLRLASDLQAARRRLVDQQQSISEDERKLRERMAEVDRTRQYTIVGRLSASTLYDGKRLPLMYRVQTIGGPAPRTLAYIKPDPTMNIASKLGQVVGVIGAAKMDPTLRLNIIAPQRVDTLEATPAAETPAAPAPSETPA